MIPPTCFLLLLMLSGTALPEPDREIISPCAECSAAKAVMENAFPSENTDDIRVELIKEEILMKLRMKEPPRVKRPVLPDVLINEYLITAEEQQEQQKSHYNHFSRDDFYGATHEVVIFPENANTHTCDTEDELNLSSCFSFRLTKEITSRRVSSAKLWVHKIGNINTDDVDVEEMENSNVTVTYTVVEVASDPIDDDFSRRVVAIEETSEYPGWLILDVSHTFRKWALHRHSTHTLEIRCNGCDLEMESPVSLADGQKPFIIVHMDSWKSSRKTKREAECTEDSTYCCKKYFKIDFRDINWDSWVIHPLSYVANICQGSCTTDATDSRHPYTAIVRRYLTNLTTNNVNISLCCTATKMSPLSVIYMDKNNNIFKKTLPNMIVDSCSCT